IQSDIWTTVQHDEKTPNCKIVLKEVGGQYFPCIERLPGAQGTVPRCNLRALGNDIHRKLPTIGQLLLRNVPMEKEVNEVFEMITARQDEVRTENEALLTRIKDLTNDVEKERKRRAVLQLALLSARGASQSKLDEKQSSLQEEPRCNLRALGHDIHLKLPTIGQLLLRNVPMEKEVNEVFEMITARQNVVRQENETLLTRIKDLTNDVEKERKRRAVLQLALLSARGASQSKLDEKQSSLQEERDACTALQAQNTALEAELARLQKKLEKNML
ncbi:hypothetical protein AAVH_09636, partial [Aphelenchoides avenae]